MLNFLTEVRIWMTEIQIWTTNFMAQIYFANLNDSFMKWNDKSAKLTGKTFKRELNWLYMYADVF